MTAGLWFRVLRQVFNDPIHGTVPLHPLLVKIIDTPQFQRLRHLKQLGGCYFVYPGASHNRFEHSIGVAHLAGKLVEALRSSRSDLKITDRDVLCVQIAGLCHDLGHGPFSHLFETFIKKERPEKGWKHEEASLLMFDYMVEHNHLEKMMTNRLELPDDHLELPIDLMFIKEMIEGWIPTDEQPLPKGRPDQPFFYDIVNNKRNGIDVDKFDYLARDAHHLGIKSSFDHLRFIHFARVCEVDGRQQICTRHEEVENLYDLFHLRYLLHSRAYQHKVSNIIEAMITEAFSKADKHIKIEGSIKGSVVELLTLSTAIDDMEAYTKLTDDVFGRILHSSNKKLSEAKKILEKIVTRQHYRFLGEVKPTEVMKNDFNSKGEKAMEAEWIKELAKACQGDGLTKDDFVVHVVKMNYGKGGDDPIKKMRFYSKSDQKTGVELPEDKTSMYMPRCFSEERIRVYCKKIDIDATSLTNAQRCMDAWCKPKEQPRPEPVEQAPADQPTSRPADQPASEENIKTMNEAVWENKE
ncbi:deoxynucleoside triphosphate triphosphohydrolase SAMHD1-like [Pseudoliparis swirei]|uniref:deoxynucleoside triphosphate triphosphohydrolase SAMHD1-like n=1 Tax=Pseudoliparis swirei TaxID=2059687 RepID=UPI0024BEE951|nr:deoxynucleoside triphosphate triphosphohydrolase SAMHD1-like [Pseudoliparis swirei]